MSVEIHCRTNTDINAALLILRHIHPMCVFISFVFYVLGDIADRSAVCLSVCLSLCLSRHIRALYSNGRRFLLRTQVSPKLR